MIPLIGTMIGTYIITKMLSLLTRSNSKEHLSVKIAAVITVLVSILGIALLLFGSLR